MHICSVSLSKWSCYIVMYKIIFHCDWFVLFIFFNQLLPICSIAKTTFLLRVLAHEGINSYLNIPGYQFNGIPRQSPLCNLTVIDFSNARWTNFDDWFTIDTLISSPLPTTSQSRQSLTQATRLVRYAQANRSVTALLTYSEILEYVGIFNNTKLAAQWQKEVEHQQSNQAEATLWTQVSLFYVNFISSYNMDRLLCLILAWSTHCYLFSCPLLAIMFPWTDLWASQDL